MTRQGATDASRAPSNSARAQLRHRVEDGGAGAGVRKLGEVAVSAQEAEHVGLRAGGAGVAVPAVHRAVERHLAAQLHGQAEQHRDGEDDLQHDGPSGKRLSNIGTCLQQRPICAAITMQIGLSCRDA